MKTLATLLGAAGLLGLAAAVTPASDPQPLAIGDAVTFQVDPVHSHVLWKVKHNDAAYFYGRFNEFSGQFTFDEDDPSESHVVMEVVAKSVDTRNEKLDQHLRSPDFFNAVQYPTITFESTDVKKKKGDVYEVEGELTLHGVTKKVTLPMEHVGTSQGRRGTVIGFHTRFTVDRSDFGMNYGVGGPLGKDVELIISIEANAQ